MRHPENLQPGECRDMVGEPGGRSELQLEALQRIERDPSGLAG
jgi:hypothetical protein